MNIDLTTMPPADIYHLMTQTVIPRPIAWVLTQSGTQNYNLAPFSYFTPISSNPPLLMFSVGKKPSGEIKDTTRNVLANRKMVVHIAHQAQAESVTQTAATLEHGESEVAATGLELVSFDGFDLPRVQGCPVAFGCSLFEVKEIGDTPQSLIFAKIEQIYLDPNIVTEQGERLTIDALSLNPLSRLGGSQYALTRDVFSVARPK